jgi:hypothetical protein
MSCDVGDDDVEISDRIFVSRDVSFLYVEVCLVNLISVRKGAIRTLGTRQSSNRTPC